MSVQPNKPQQLDPATLQAFAVSTQNVAGKPSQRAVLKAPLSGDQAPVQREADSAKRSEFILGSLEAMLQLEGRAPKALLVDAIITAYQTMVEVNTPNPEDIEVEQAAVERQEVKAADTRYAYTKALQRQEALRIVAELSLKLEMRPDQKRKLEGVIGDVLVAMKDWPEFVQKLQGTPEFRGLSPRDIQNKLFADTQKEVRASVKKAVRRAAPTMGHADLTEASDDVCQQFFVSINPMFKNQFYRDDSRQDVVVASEDAQKGEFMSARMLLGV